MLNALHRNCYSQLFPQFFHILHLHVENIRYSQQCTYIYSTYDMDRSVLKTPPQSMKSLYSVWCIAHFTIHRYFVRSYLVHEPKWVASVEEIGFKNMHIQQRTKNYMEKITGCLRMVNGCGFWIVFIFLNIESSHSVYYPFIRSFVRRSPYTNPFSGEKSKREPKCATICDVTSIPIQYSKEISQGWNVMYVPERGVFEIK